MRKEVSPLAGLTGTAYLAVEGVLAGAAADPGGDGASPVTPGASRQAHRIRQTHQTRQTHQAEQTHQTRARRTRQIQPSRPVAVISTGRVADVCAAAAREGVARGMTVRYARRVCPYIRTVNIADIPRGAAESRREGLCRAAYRLSPRVEPDPPSGLYFTLKECPREDLIRMVRAVIPRLGHRLRVGIAPNRLLARIAARGPAVGRGRVRGGYRLKLGPSAEVFIIPPGSEGSFLAPMSVDALWPLSRDIRQRLRDLGLDTAGDVAAAGAARLQRVLGADGLQAARLAAGVDHTPVAAAYPPPGVERSADLPAGFNDGGALKTVITKMAREAGAELERSFRAAGQVVVTLSPAEDGKLPWSRSRSLNSPGPLGPSTREAVVQAARSLADMAANDARLLKGGIASVHLEARRLRPASPVQTGLWTSGGFPPDPSRRSEDSRAWRSEDSRARRSEDSRGDAGLPAFASGGAGGAAPSPDGGGRGDLSRLVKGLRRRFPPSAISLGWEAPDAYREKMLSYWDPLRMG